MLKRVTQWIWAENDDISTRGFINTEAEEREHGKLYIETRNRKPKLKKIFFGMYYRTHKFNLPHIANIEFSKWPFSLY